ICSPTARSMSGFTSRDRLTRTPRTERFASPIFACPDRFGSIRQFGRIAGRTFIVTLNVRPAILPNWRIEPNLSGQANIGDANLSVLGVRVNLSREVKPLIDRAVGEQ